jgi:hypothetical protein
MDSITQDLIDYLREAAKTTPSILATSEETAYFAPTLPKQKKEQVKPLPPPPVYTPKKAEPAPVIQKVEAPAPAPKPIPAAEKKNLNEMRQMIQKTFPDIPLRESILDDGHAKKMSRLWEETYLNAQIVVIAFGEVGSGLEFLKQVVRAIDTLIAPAQLIEGNQITEWELLLNSPTLKSILCSPWAAWKTTPLARHYKQNGSTQEQFLAQHRLFLLEPSVIYLKNPDRKRKLWQLISTQLLS